MDNYNYPVGSDTPDAPWNQCDTPELTFEVTISQSLSRTTKVTTNDYVEGEVSEDADHDDEGNWFTTFTQGPPDTSDTDWRGAYSNEHSTPLELIAELKKSKEREARHLEAQILIATDDETKRTLKKLLRRAQYSISECDGWIEDDCEIVEG